VSSSGSLNLPLSSNFALGASQPVPRVPVIYCRQADLAAALSISTLTLAVILTATARKNFPDPLPWAATLILGGLGLLAVLADNPLTLLMAWSAIDLTELVTQLRSADGPQPSEKVVTAFALVWLASVYCYGPAWSVSRQARK
jgi:hypothetical protein